MTGYRTSEHNETNAHWRIFCLFCKMETNVAYISASVNIVKISILMVSRQRHSSWNSALDVLKLSEWEALQMTRTRRRELNESFKLIHEPKRLTGLPTALIKPLNRIDSKEWIIREWASLIAQRTVDVALGINWSIFNLYCIKIK